MHWTEIWHSPKPGPAILRTVLIPLSWLYTAGWQTYLLTYKLGLKKPQEPHNKVVCIGNLVVGGSGKSPLTLFVARQLQQLGREVVLSCSGYGSPASEGAQLAPPGPLDPNQWGDEPAMFRLLAPDLPIVVGRRRTLAAQLVHQHHPKAIMLMDDGFQHLPLKKHLTIVIDKPTRNRRCLPAGPYREPARNGKRADLLLPNEMFTLEAKSEIRNPKSEINHQSSIINHPSSPPNASTPQRPNASPFPDPSRQSPVASREISSKDERRMTNDDPPETLDPRPETLDPRPETQAPRPETLDPRPETQALSALGDPRAFLQSLRDQGHTLAHTKSLPDHDPLDAGNLFQGFDPSLPIVVTAKDWVKLRNRPDIENWDIRVAMLELSVEPQDEFLAWLAHRLNGL